MDCKDLMIGDWVICNDLKMQVAAIGETVGFLDCNNQVYWAYEGFDRIDPIPLTEEILMKNGFVKTWNGDWQLKEYSTIIISKDYYVEIFERSIRIDYVHELQHMLHAACVGKELVID